jgi:hypothetical protein
MPGSGPRTVRRSANQCMTALLIGIAVVVLVVIAVRRQATPRSAVSQPSPGAAIGSLEADRQTLHALRSAGSDLTKPTHVLFYLYFDTKEIAEKAASSATTSELEATVRPAATGSNWLLLLQGTMVPTESAIHGTSARLAALASSLAGEYDGWEAAVTR